MLHTQQVFNLLGEYEFLPNREAVSFLFGQICRTTPLACASIITAVAGLNTGGREVAGRLGLGWRAAWGRGKAGWHAVEAHEAALHHPPLQTT